MKWPAELKYDGPHVNRHGAMAKMRLKVGEAISDVVLQVVKGTRKTYQKTTAQRSKHNGLREREEDAADCTSRLKMDAFSKNFFYKGILFIGLNKIVLSMKEKMRFHELSVLAKEDIYGSRERNLQKTWSGSYSL